MCKAKLVKILRENRNLFHGADVSAAQLLRLADCLIENGVVVHPWIPVTEQLPEDDPSVKKHIEGEKFGFFTVLVYNGVVKETNRFFCNEPRYGLSKTNGWEWASSNVTHWMPLPQPPEVTP